MKVDETAIKPQHVDGGIQRMMTLNLFVLLVVMVLIPIGFKIAIMFILIGVTTVSGIGIPIIILKQKGYLTFI